MVSPGIEEPDKVRGQERLSRCLAPGRSILTGFLAKDLLRLDKIIGGRRDLGGLSRPALMP